MHSPALLLFCAGIAVAGLVILTTYCKLSAFLALIIASVFVGLCAGLEPARLMQAFQGGVGSVLGSIAMLIALGSVLGKILGETGGAAVLSNRLIQFFGARWAGLAFFLIGLIVGLPTFFSVGIVLVVPILFATAIEHRLPLLRLALPAVAGLSATHGLVPPHPGPLAAIGFLHADLGKTLLLSLPVAAAAGYIAGPLFARFLPESELRPQEPHIHSEQPATNNAPGFGVTLCAILLPIVLIGLGTICDWIFPRSGSNQNLLLFVPRLLGDPVIALLIGVLFSYVTLGRSTGFSRVQLLKLTEQSLGSVAMVLLVIGAGAGFSRVLIESGVGKVVADIATRWNMRAVPMGFILASLVRVATGSATVAITTSAGLVKPIADAQPGTNLELLVLAMGSGSLILSHVNDGGFWLVKEYLNLSVPQALRTWTVLETILALAAFAVVMLLDVLQARIG
jgi:GntP family gluconate:H+ symporter